MANGNGGSETTPVRGAVDYKTLFFGACALVTLLGGGYFGLWGEGNDDLKRTNVEQWKRINDIGDRLLTSTARIESLERAGQDREERLRALEREVYRTTRR